MKQLLLLILSCVCSVILVAQNKANALQLFRSNQAYLESMKTNSWRVSNTDTTKKEPFKSLVLGNRKPGVYLLPQDNMPCIVPDLWETVAIPNLWKGEKKVPYKAPAPRIPNHLKVSPSRPLLKYPEDVTK